MSAETSRSSAATIVAADARTLWGEQTRLALSNFPHDGRTLGSTPAFLHAYALVKAACARANVQLGTLPADLGLAVVTAALDVAAGRHDDQFPTALLQGGGGTSTNMNLNEVIASLANGAGLTPWPVLPQDHVNRSQSTNDTYPTAMAMALIDLAAPAVEALRSLESTLLSQAERHGAMARLGRTCLQDAVPLTVGETHRAQARGVRRGRVDIEAALSALTTVPLGGTAVGTGIGAPPGFAVAAIAHLNKAAGTSLTLSEDYFDSLANLDPYTRLADALARSATTIARVASDLRLLASGPLGGLGEVRLPARQAGSSIMPGKVNPVIPELAIQLGHRIRGCAHTVRLAVADGELELNIMEPVVLDSLLTMLTDLTDAASYLDTRCVDGLTWDRESLDRNLRGSVAPLVDVARTQGYQAAAAASSPDGPRPSPARGENRG